MFWKMLFRFFCPLYVLAIDGATLTTISGMLKRFYPEGKITSTLYNKLPLLKLLKKETTSVKNTGYGLTAYVPIQVLRNQSVGSIAEGAALTVPRNNTYIQLEVGLAYSYARKYWRLMEQSIMKLWSELRETLTVEPKAILN